MISTRRTTTASGWALWIMTMLFDATSRQTAAATANNPTINSPALLAFWAPINTFRQHHVSQPRSITTRRAPLRSRGGTIVPVSMSSALESGETSDKGDDSVSVSSCRKSIMSTSTRKSSGAFLNFMWTTTCSAIPGCGLMTAAAAGASAAEVVVGDAGGAEMGARLDAPAAISFGAIVVAFAFLQARIRTAVRARTARRDYEVLFKGMKAKQLAGQADEEEVALVEERMSQLLREEKEARMVDIFGIPFNLVIPDGGAGGEPGTGAREAQQGGRGASRSAGMDGGGAESTRGRGSDQQLGIREAMKAKAESDLREGKAREEEMSTGSTLKVAALWLVLISQLWLLLVLWNDPMGPASSAFLKD